MISDDVVNNEHIRRMGAKMMFLRHSAQRWLENRGYPSTNDDNSIRVEMNTRWIRLFIGLTVAAIVRPDASGVLVRALSLPPDGRREEAWETVLRLLSDVWPILMQRKDIMRIVMPRMLDDRGSEAFRVFTNRYIMHRITEACAIDGTEYWIFMERTAPSSIENAVRSSIVFMKDVDAKDALSFSPSVDNFQSSILTMFGAVALVPNPGDPTGFLINPSIGGRGLKRPRE
jgi:hypothetical protein